MPTDDPNRPDPTGDAVAGWTLLQIVARSVAYPHELIAWAPGTMGREYPGVVAAVGGLLVVPWAVVAVAPPHYGVEWITLHWWGLVIWAVVHRVARGRRGGHTHRHYVGDPLSRYPDPTRWRETVFGLAVALAWFAVCDTLGWLHLAATACSRVNLALATAREDRVVRRMKDGQAEGRYYAERMRDGR